MLQSRRRESIGAFTMAAALSAELQGLAARLRSIIGNESAGRAIMLVVERAPDERMALAGLLRLAESTAPALERALQSRDLAADLIFALGSSEIVLAWLCATPAWLERFESTRSLDGPALQRLISLKLDCQGDRAALAQGIAAFKADIFARLIIADLLGRIDVAQTMALMSRLADECIAEAVRAARALIDGRAQDLAGFCVLALGKLGVNELNLS